MKKMLQITSVALLISFISFPSSVFAQSFSGNQEGFLLSTPVIIVAGISLIFGFGLIYSLLDIKKDLTQAQ
jgi:hypothetical protein